MARVSAIIPAYNCEKYIVETIESVFAQTHKDIELIVVDDGSTDRTEEIIRSFGARLNYIRQDKNSGPSAARNRGIKESSGAYVAFLDHDDIWLPDKIEEQVRMLEREKDLALVYSNFYYINRSGSIMGKLFDNIKPCRGFVFEELVISNFIPTSSVVIRKKVLDETGIFDERFLIAQDYDLYIRIAERHKIDFIERPLLKYMVHPDGASKKRRRITLEEAIDIASFYRDKVKATNARIAQRLDHAIARYKFYIAIWLLQNADRRSAINQYFQCLRTGAFDYKIILGAGFFLMPGFISNPLIERTMKIGNG